jgi:signal transduction histidine kinase
MASTRRLRRAREAAFQARLPIEVSRLRLHLRQALHQVRASRARLVAAAAEERRRLERDLHDGAQQQIVSVGMRLRSTQRRLDTDGAAYAELDAAVEVLEATIAELRRLAHGIRPERLDDGLPAALGVLVADAPVPVELRVSPVPVDDTIATTAYFVIAESYTNALKHARAGRIAISVAEEGTSLRIEVADDGIGGADGGLSSVRDRVASVGGDVRVVSPPGAGTRVVVEIPDAYRRG